MNVRVLVHVGCLWCIVLCGAGCGIKDTQTYDFGFQETSHNSQFVSDVIDLGDTNEIFRWGALQLKLTVPDWVEFSQAEHCLTNNGSPRLGNYYTCSRSPDIVGNFTEASGRNAKHKIYVSHDVQEILQPPVTFNWGDNWSSAKYFAQFDFGQAFAYTRVEVDVVSNYPNQFLPHIIVYTGNASDGEYIKLGEGWLPRDAKEKLDARQAYHGKYRIVANLNTSLEHKRFLRIIFDKPQIGISHVIVPQVQVWGKVQSPDQLLKMKLRAVSAAHTNEIDGPVEEVFKDVNWFSYGQPIPCPENRFIRFLIDLDPAYQPVLLPTGISGQLEASVF